jgi:hypothetical protein
VQEEEELYRWQEEESDSASVASASGSDEDEISKSNNDNEHPLPMGELLRRRAGSAKEEDNVKVKSDAVDIDEEIRRLEAELANDDDASDDESDSDDDGSRERKDTFGSEKVHEIEKAEQSGDSAAVLCLSTVADERIEPLPAKFLPQNKRRKLRGIDEDADGDSKPKAQKASNGLEEAVKEVLSGYIARSSERLPFYCRFCAKQYKDQTEFFEHKNTDFQKTAVEMERKASFCKLCRKQFTSPVQLKEHVSSRPHKERLQMLKSSQQQKRLGDPRLGNGGSARQRQWC